MPVVYDLGEKVFQQLACYINMDMMQFDYRPLEKTDHSHYSVPVEGTDDTIKFNICDFVDNSWSEEFNKSK